MPSNDLHAPNTNAGRVYETEGASGDPKDVAYFNSDIAPMPVVDEYVVGAEERKELGVKDDEWIIFPSRDEYWPRRMAAMRQRYGEARSLTKNPSGVDPCEHMHNHMVAVPRAAYEARMKRMEMQGTSEDAKYKERPGNLLEKKENLFDRDEDAILMRREANEQMFADMGIGSSGMTAGMTLADGMEYLERQGFDPSQMADRARSGGHHRQDNQANWKSAMQDNGRGKTFAMNAGVGKSAQQVVSERHGRNNTASQRPSKATR